MSVYSTLGLVPSQARKLVTGSYIVYGLITLTVIILFAQPVDKVAYNLMGSPEVMILMLVVAGVGVAALFGSTLMKGSFMSSMPTKYLTYIMMFIFFILVIYAFISFSTYGQLVMVLAIIISVICFVAFFFQKQSMS